MIQGKKEEQKYLAGNLFEGMVSLKAVCECCGKEGGRSVKRVLFDEGKLPKKALDLALVSTDLILSHYYLAQVKKAAKQAQS